MAEQCGDGRFLVGRSAAVAGAGRAVRDGRVILSPGAYSSATSVSAGIIRVESDSWFDYTVIDSTFSGTGASFSSGSDVHNGMFYDYVEGGEGKKTMRLRRITGEVLFQTDSLVPGSRIIGPDFDEGMVVVANDQEDYFYDFEGRRVLGPYVRAYGFRDGLAPVRMIDTAGRFRWGYIDPRGESAVPATWDSVSSAGPDLLAVGVREEGRLRWGYINRSGAWVIEPMYDEARSFRDGLGAVMMRGDSGRVVDMHGCLIMDERIEPLPYWGFIDRTGEIVIPIRFSSVSDFSNGIATAHTRGDSNVSGLIDRQGRWKFDSTRFLWVGPFSDGVAAATSGVHLGSRTTGEVGYIDGDGEWTQPPRYDIGGPFRNGHAVVADPRLTADYLYITPDGEIIWDSRTPDLPDEIR